MKILVLLAYCENTILRKYTECVITILKELDVEIEKINLLDLPYFNGTVCPDMELIKEQIEEAKGLIVISSVHIVGMHGSIQSFLDHMSVYPNLAEAKTLFTLTYSDWLGEREAGNTIVKAWDILGGTQGGMLCLNGQMDKEEISISLERHMEAFYRVIKQNRPMLPSSDRQIYSRFKDFCVNSGSQESRPPILGENPGQIRSLVDIIKQDEMLNKQQISNTQSTQAPIKETLGNFTPYAVNAYKKASTVNETTNAQSKKLQSIPHYFIAQYDKDLEMIIQYIVLDKGEKGFITIKEGDCFYTEGMIESPQVEISLTEEVLRMVLSKQMTYQKAFMLGKLKVRGNFVILPKLDQIFKAM